MDTHMHTLITNEKPIERNGEIEHTQELIIHKPSPRKARGDRFGAQVEGSPLQLRERKDERMSMGQLIHSPHSSQSSILNV